MKSVFTLGMFTLDFGYTGDCSVNLLGPNKYKVKKNAIYYDKTQHGDGSVVRAPDS